MPCAEIVTEVERIAEAKGETRGRILEDRKRVSAGVRPILEHIAEHLFEEGYNASALRAAIMPDGVKPRKTELREMADVLGLPLARYIRHHRMLTAERLLETTALDVREIAKVVRVATPSSFSTYFAQSEKRGRPPKEYRRATQETASYTAKDWRRAWSCFWVVPELSAEQCAMIRAAAMAQKGWRAPEEDFEGLAGAILAELAESGLEETLNGCREMALYSGEVFEALSLRSREEGRKNRQRGLEIAEIALATVEGSLERLAERKYDLLALAWARLANARRLAMDLDGAEQAIRKAERWAEKAAEPDRTQAEALLFKGSLRLFQRRFTDALAAYSRSVALSQAANARLVLIDALFMRASLHLYRGDPAEAMPDLDKARHLLPPEDKRRRLVAVQHLLGAANLAGDHERARQLLPEAQRLSRETGDHASSFQIQWLEGLMLRENGESETAEPLLKQARAGFLRLGDADMAAVVSLELAMLYHDQGTRADEVIAYASDALPALVALDVPEAFGAIQLLRQAVREQKIHRQILETARNRLLAPASPE